MTVQWPTSLAQTEPLRQSWLQNAWVYSCSFSRRHRTAVHLLYLIPYASIYIQYILLPPLTCFSVPTPLTPVTVNLWAQCIPTKLVLFVSCIYHWMSVYILCTSTKCRLCTTPVVSHPLLPHNPPPFPPSYLHPADLKQMGSPLCAVVLLKVPSWLTGSFFLPVLPMCLH